MDNSSNGDHKFLIRRSIYGAISGGVVGALGATFARPLVAVFRDSPPWVLPAIAAGLLGGLMLALLLIPLLLKRRSRQ
jgi:di/tricarboxylate transporter